MGPGFVRERIKLERQSRHDCEDFFLKSADSEEPLLPGERLRELRQLFPEARNSTEALQVDQNGRICVSRNERMWHDVTGMECCVSASL